jgi:ferric-dicitrate binding protein FerR (iron transport regulator)
VATNKHIADLIMRYRRSTLNEQEKKELEAWCNLCEENQLLFNRLNDAGEVSGSLVELYSESIDEEGGKIRQMFPTQQKQCINTAIKYTAIVTGLLLISMGVYSLLNGVPNKKGVVVDNQPKEGLSNNQLPDVHRVQLKLADGRIVYLDSSVNGHIALQYRSVIYKRGDLVRYEWSNGNAQPELEHNTIITPRARKFTLELPDGSRACLNASSSITYPTAFIGKERIVHITGEVYFEVNPDPVSLGTRGGKMPFIVYVNPLWGAKGAGAVVEVTGTNFDINAYGDEPVIKTTLLQGKIKVSNQFQPVATVVGDINKQHSPGADQQPEVQSVFLIPGQQAVINGEGQLDVIKYADIQEVMAWQKDLIIYNDLDIKQIMQQLARQYDYEIVFKEPVNGHYTLSVTRQTTIKQVLDVLELSGGIHFDIEDHKIIVSQ